MCLFIIANFVTIGLARGRALNINEYSIELGLSFRRCWLFNIKNDLTVGLSICAGGC